MLRETPPSLTSGDRGGAIYVSSGSVCTNACTFSGNTAHDGGAIYITANGIVVNNGDTSVAGLTSITGNTATVNGGGGITNYGKLSTEGSLTVTGNTAKGNGGGIWNNGIFEAKGTVTVRGNKSNGADNNLYLKSGKVITLTGALDSTSEIRVSAENPLAAVTSGWSERMGETAPAGCIAYDDGLSTAVPKNGEVSFRMGFVDRSWKGSAVVREDTYTPDDVTPILYNGQAELTDVWVIVSRSQTLSGRQGINGNVRLILMDGVTLTCTEGVRVSADHTLTVYGQKDGSGKLAANGRKYTAGIGSNDQDDGNNDSAGTINICGGTIVAQGGEDSAGIGGGNEANGGAINIYGGTVKATGGEDGAGIGGGDEGTCGTVTICGGSVTATGEHAAGIGCGDGSAAIGTVIIRGGTVHATGGNFAAGIGGSSTTTVDSGTIRITGGTVVATGKRGGAGIGSGYDASCGATIIISGGTVTATCEGDGAGIGGGDGDGLGGGNFTGTITISGGTVTATGGGHTYHGDFQDTYFGGSGIGSGDSSHMQGTITISGGTVRATGNYGGAAIGGGHKGKCTGTVNITGGSVHLYTDHKDSTYDNQCVAIGHGTGDSFTQNGTLNLGSGIGVRLNGSSVSSAARVSTCQSILGSGHLELYVCEHSGAAYTATGSGHTPNCPYCLDHTEETHTFDLSTHLCTVCGYEYNGYLITIGFEGNGGTGNMAEVRVMPHASYRLPENGFTAPDGKRFKEWTVGTYGISVPVARAPGYLIEDVTGNLVVRAIWQSIPFSTPDFVLPDGLAEIGANAFEGVEATVVEIPAGCGSVGDHAFRDCTALTMIRIPADCALGTDVFEGCTKVYVFSAPGSPAESYCLSHGNCVFVEDGLE